MRTDGEVPREVLQETSYDQASIQATIDQRTPNLTEDQRYAVETFLTSVGGEERGQTISSFWTDQEEQEKHTPPIYCWPKFALAVGWP